MEFADLLLDINSIEFISLLSKPIKTNFRDTFSWHRISNSCYPWTNWMPTLINLWFFKTECLCTQYFDKIRTAYIFLFGFSSSCDGKLCFAWALLVQVSSKNEIKMAGKQTEKKLKRQDQFIRTQIYGYYVRYLIDVRHTLYNYLILASNVNCQTCWKRICKSFKCKIKCRILNYINTNLVADGMKKKMASKSQTMFLLSFTQKLFSLKESINRE